MKVELDWRATSFQQSTFALEIKEFELCKLVDKVGCEVGECWQRMVDK